MKESYRPFRSEKAKETYLAYYDEHAKRWLIASEYSHNELISAFTVSLHI